MKKSTEELRKSICATLKIVDRRTLKMVEAMLRESIMPDDGVEGEELERELNRRVKLYKTGKTKLLTFQEVKARYNKRRKKRES